MSCDLLGPQLILAQTNPPANVTHLKKDCPEHLGKTYFDHLGEDYTYEYLGKTTLKRKRFLFRGSIL